MKNKMAICKYCNKEMVDPITETCNWNEYIIFPDGSKLPSVPFVVSCLTEKQWMDMWKENNYDTNEDAAKLRCAEYLKRKDRCHDCNIKDGGKHHPGCDNERCPKCSGQLISCECLEE